MTTEQVAIDNDVLLKLACYCLLDEVPRVTGLESRDLHVLGAARYVVPSVISRSSRIADKVRAQTNFARFISEVGELEPTPVEVQLATQIEELALVQGVSLDTGESQLGAIVIVRLFSLLITGDKRAITGLEQLRDQLPALAAIEGRAASLEQLIARIVRKVGADTLRQLVCAEKNVDRAISTCCACSSLEAVAAPLQGLLSYVQDLRTSAPRVLAKDYELLP